MLSSWYHSLIHAYFFYIFFFLSMMMSCSVSSYTQERFFPKNIYHGAIGSVRAGSDGVNYNVWSSNLHCWILIGSFRLLHDRYFPKRIFSVLLLPTTHIFETSGVQRLITPTSQRKGAHSSYNQVEINIETCNVIFVQTSGIDNITETIQSK